MSSHNYYAGQGANSQGLNQQLPSHQIQSYTTNGFQGNLKHHHPLNSDKICCHKHILELNNFFKQQGRYFEAGDAVIKFFNRPNLISVLLNDESVDFNTKKSLFMICNEHASRFTVSNDVERAQILLEKAQALSHEMPPNIKATLYSNISCFYEKNNDDQNALTYLNQAMIAENQANENTPSTTSNISTNTAMNSSDLIGNAISHNNLAVLELKQQNYSAALKASKASIMTLEPKIFQEMKQSSLQGVDLKRDKPFIDKLQVLLISYFNMGVSQIKMNNLQYAKTVFEQGFKLGKKYLGEEHFFTQRFIRRMSKPSGSSATNRLPSPQRSIKNDTSIVSGGGGGMIPQQRINMGASRGSTGYGPMMNQDESEIIVDINVNNRPQTQMLPQQQMKVINKGENRKIITSQPSGQHPQLSKDASGVSVLDSAHSSQNQHPIYAMQQRQESRKKSELMQMVKDSQEDPNNFGNQDSNLQGGVLNSNHPANTSISHQQNPLTHHEQSIENPSYQPQQQFRQSQANQFQYHQNQEDINKKKEELMKQLEDEFKAKQELLQKQQEQESKKIQDLLCNLNQNQSELSKKWEEFQRKQEEFERKIAQEKTDLIMERQKILDENRKAEEEKQKHMDRFKLDEKMLELEKLKLQQQAESEQKQKQAYIQQELEKQQKEELEREKEKQKREYEEMMKQMQAQQEKYKQMEQQMDAMARQQRELEEQKRKVKEQEERIEKEKQELAEKQRQAEIQAQAKKQPSLKADINFNSQVEETKAKQQLSSAQQNPPIKISIQEKPKEELKPVSQTTSNNGMPPFMRQTSRAQGSSYNVLAKPEDIGEDQKKSLQRLQSSSKLIKDVRKQGDAPNLTAQPAHTNNVGQTPSLNPSFAQSPVIQSTINSNQVQIAAVSKFEAAAQEEIKVADTPKSSANNIDRNLMAGPAISDVSSIKESAKNGGSTGGDNGIYTFTMEQLNEIIEEDIKLYDASIILSKKIVRSQFKTPKIVSQVVYCDGNYYKMYCEGYLGKDGKPIFKMHGVCEDSKIQVIDEELIFFEMRSILNLIIVKDVLPPTLPIKNIRTFTDICKYFIFPFLLTTQENKAEENQTPDSNNNAPVSSSRNSNERFIEIWGRSPGLLSQPTQIMIMKNLCNVSLHYATDRYFKLAITSLDHFEKFFKVLDPAEFQIDGKVVPLKEDEIKLPSIKIVDKEFLFEIEGALKAFENYLFNEFGNEVQFSYVVYERTGLIYQLRVKDEGNIQELWCVKDNPKNQSLEVFCKTLYELRIKKHCIQQVERRMTVDYNQIWVIFGVPLGNQNPLRDPSKKQDEPGQQSVDRSQHIMMAGYFLQTSFLHMPTMELNKGDLEDSDYEEEVNISQKKIECIMHIRKLLDVNGEKMPLTIQLLGYDNTTYLGIKVTAYNPTLIKETGVFLSVDQLYWQLTDEQKHNLPKKKSTKAEVLLDHYHIPDLLRRNGFLIIFNNLIIKKNEKTVKWKGPYGESHIDVFESYFTRGSTSH